MMPIRSTRKVTVGIILLVVGVGITLLKGDIPTNLLSLMQILYSAFVIGNGIEHATAAMSSRKNTSKEQDN